MKMKSANRRKDLLGLLFGLVVLVLVNIISSYLFARVDLTSEGRYTLRPGTVKLLREMKDMVNFNIYLEGEFPQGTSDYRRLRDETKLMLDEFRVYAGNRINYQFINPISNPDEGAQKKVVEQLQQKGVTAYPVVSNADDGSTTTKYIFPYALASINGTSREVSVPLLGTKNFGADPNRVNKAVVELEYQLVNAIKKLRQAVRPKVAILQGHGEPDTLMYNIHDLAESLKEYYEVEYVDMQGHLFALRDSANRLNYKALIIPRPVKRFSEQDKVAIDQYVMHGGNVLWMVDPVNVKADTLFTFRYSNPEPDSLNIDDLLFSYGVRLNHDIVIDRSCSQIPLIFSGNNYRDMKPYSWPYYPIVFPRNNHPIVTNLDAVQLHFASSISPLSVPGVNSTVLLSSSKNSGYLSYAVTLQWDYLAIQSMLRSPAAFKRSNIPLAVLLEGKFTSAYANKPLQIEMQKYPQLGYLPERKDDKGRMIVIADGDICLNAVDRQQGAIKELGYDGYMYKATGGREFMYANKPFLLNCVNYLCYDDEMLELRTREVSLRKLDSLKVERGKTAWMIYNSVMPVVFVILFGLAFFFVHRAKYVRGAVKLSSAVVSLMMLVIFVSAGWVISLGTEGMSAIILLLLVPVLAAGIAWMLSQRFSK